MFELDKGSEGSTGPWLVWAAQETKDGKIPGRTFYVREGTGENAVKTPLPSIKEGGVVLDIHALKTGWQYGTGVKGQAPQWKFGESPAKLPERPGEDWKKGFSMPVAVGGGKVADWEQSGAAAWNCLVALIPAINAGPAGDPSKLPLVRFVGSTFEQFDRGSTHTPQLEIVEWVDRPGCLKPGFDAGGAAPAPEAAAAPPAPSAPPPAAPPANPASIGTGF